MTGNIDGEKDEFLVSIEPKKEFIRKLFRKISTKETIGLIFSTLQKVFQDNPDIEVMKN
ncbi:MAG: hypothetical protein R2728_04585 [Chitinophagales bacterium]